MPPGPGRPRGPFESSARNPNVKALQSLSQQRLLAGSRKRAENELQLALRRRKIPEVFGYHFAIDFQEVAGCDPQLFAKELPQELLDLLACEGSASWAPPWTPSQAANLALQGGVAVQSVEMCSEV